MWGMTFPLLVDFAIIRQDLDLDQYEVIFRPHTASTPQT